jgi:hypothetical protein
MVGAFPDGIGDDPPLPHPTIADTAISSTADSAEETHKKRTEPPGTLQGPIVCNKNNRNYIYHVSQTRLFRRRCGNGKSRSPSGMTTRKTTATAKAAAKAAGN